MKRIRFRSLIMIALVSSALIGEGCKGKNKEKEPVVQPAADTPQPSAPAPVEIATDDALTTNVRDAVKDFPGVTAEVKEGEIILTGTLERSKLPTLMQSLNSLRPKKITNNLTLQ